VTIRRASTPFGFSRPRRWGPSAGQLSTGREGEAEPRDQTERDAGRARGPLGPVDRTERDVHVRMIVMLVSRTHRMVTGPVWLGCVVWLADAMRPARGMWRASAM
jgi:hypothetical protein